MQTHYQIRKSKEYITLKCGKLCYNKGGSNYMEDDLTRFEKNCLINCYHKTFRYLVHANTAYSFFTGDEELLKELTPQEDIDTGSMMEPV
jgi:hypothetical protein